MGPLRGRAPEAPVARPADQGSLQARLAVLEGLMGTAARVLEAAPQDAGADAEDAELDAELSAAATRVQAAAPALEPRVSPRAAVEKAAATEAAASSAISEMGAAASRDAELMAEVARLRAELGRGARREAAAHQALRKAIWPTDSSCSSGYSSSIMPLNAGCTIDSAVWLRSSSMSCCRC